MTSSADTSQIPASDPLVEEEVPCYGVEFSDGSVLWMPKSENADKTLVDRLTLQLISLGQNGFRLKNGGRNVAPSRLVRPGFQPSSALRQ